MNSSDQIESALTEPDGYVVVSWWQDKSSMHTGHYAYEDHVTLNDALDAYADYERREYSRAREVGIFAVRNGMPTGVRIHPVTGQVWPSSQVLAEQLEQAAADGLRSPIAELDKP